MYCKNCGIEMNENQAFCADCGTAAGQGGKFCQSCGTAVVEGASFCPNCGTALNNNPQPEPSTTESTAAYQNPVYQNPASNYQNPAYQNPTPNYQYQNYQNPKPNVQSPEYLNGQDKTVMALLCFFLGGLGVHNFMMGETKKGIFKIVMSCCFFIGYIFAIIDLVKILTDKYEVDPDKLI